MGGEHSLDLGLDEVGPFESLVDNHDFVEKVSRLTRFKEGGERAFEFFFFVKEFTKFRGEKSRNFLVSAPV